MRYIQASMYWEQNRFQRLRAAALDMIERKSFKYIFYRFEWWLAKEFSYLPRRPLNIDIELSDACNLRCTMCVHGMDGLPNVGHMDNALAEEVLREASALRVPAVKFNWRGEPGLHPNLIEYIRRAKEMGFIDIQINTNLVSFSEAKIAELVNSGIHRIIVSCDGATKETYEDIRVGSSFERLERNLSLILKIKKLNNLRYPKVRIQFVKQRRNYHEVEMFLERFRGLADDLRISEVSNRGVDGVLNVGDQIAVGRKRCEQPWQRLIVSKDGNVHPCCNDWDQLYPLGSLNSASISEIWQSSKLADLRQVNLDGKLDEHPMCKNCFVPESYVWQQSSRQIVPENQLNAFGRMRESK